MSNLHRRSLNCSLLHWVVLAVILASVAPEMASQTSFIFQPPQSYTITTSPNLVGTLVVSDFNGDGKPDLGAGFVDPVANGPLQFGLLVNNGASFSPVALTQVQPGVGGQTTAWGAAADFNNDGRMDLAEGTGNYGITAPGIFILLGNGNGTFQPAKLYGPTMIGPIAVGDFNNDGIPDVFGIDTSGGGAYCLAVLLGKGDGTFGSPVCSLAITPGSYVVAGDYNNDGNLDVALVVANAVFIFFGNGDGTFTAGPEYQPISGSIGNINGIAVGDVNGDGIPDIVVGTIVSNFPNATSLVVMLGNGDGTFQNGLTTAAPTGAAPAAIADFNLDGKADLLCLLNGNQVSFAAGNGDGTFQTPQNVNIDNPAYNAVVGDFDGNSAPDVAVVGATSLSVLYNGFGIGLGAGSNSTSSTVTAGQTANYTLSIGGGRLSGTATLTCTGAPQGATCSVPGSVTVNGTSASSFKVSVTTTSQTTAAANSSRTTRFAAIWTAALLPLVVLPIRRRKRASRSLYLSAIVGSLLLISSCGGNSSSSSSTSNPNGTPSGSYNLMITATLNSATESVQLKLVVQ
jgi:hypothetical protein